MVEGQNYVQRKEKHLQLLENALNSKAVQISTQKHYLNFSVKTLNWLFVAENNLTDLLYFFYLPVQSQQRIPGWKCPEKIYPPQ